MSQPSDISYTTDELAKLLKISKLTVYDLIKKGELSSYRVGKQMRVDAADLEAYKRRNRTVPEVSAGRRNALDWPASNTGRIANPQPGLTGNSSVAAPHTKGEASRQQPASNDVGTSAESTGMSLAAARLDQGTAQDQRDAATLDVRTAEIASTAAATLDVKTAEIAPTAAASSPPIPRSIVITGQDISLDILARHLETELPEYRMLRSHMGSMDSLIRLYKGEADLVSTHLLDGDSGDYNVPYIRRLLVGMPHLVVNLLTRSAGLFVAEGNPHGITCWTDLARPGMRIANREQGAGARVLLDEQLRLHRISQEGLLGYEKTLTNHLSVAAMVASGEADVGVGTAKAASIVQGVSFIPLIQERYDLVMLKKPENKLWIESVLGILRSDGFKRELRAIANYDLSRTGEIMAEA
ncbi:substrate-binding domain-containing protein [Paenibacillus agaridevorans]|uniref:substrate-binding domain-containing protein n=1 Tax=Paenibacillus agaridevorans TaxID=171404 RepID=UPI001FE90074|nr:helix-turn-helix transcriptional regulator [Paenibacillus agaridevorans]